jgi:beta-lactamase superfamily II metal-dependent hydrolase
MRDVGDGLCMQVTNSVGYELTIDYGEYKRQSWRYLYFLDYFLLSHFHSDHFNGILKSDSKFKNWHIHTFFHPIIPKFKERDEFYYCLFAVNARVTKGHPIQNFVLNKVRLLNSQPINFVPVCKGEVHSIGHVDYEILWPPQEISEETALSEIRNAIKDFNDACEKDELLKNIYSEIKKYSLEDYFKNYEERSERGKSMTDDIYIEEEKKIEQEKMSETIDKANKSLRSAANRLSVAFRQSDRLLFLGDLEEEEIEAVTIELIKGKKTSYEIIIAAHHGTHWHDNLLKFNSHLCLASVGQRLRSKIEPKYRLLCNKFLKTDDLGDIFIRYYV